MTCPPDDYLSEVLAGSAADMATFESHLTGCSSCQARLDALSDSAPLRALRANHPAEFPFLELSDRTGSIGRVGRFHLEHEIGRGGMGVVFRAWDDSLRRAIAVKILRVGRDHPGGIARFAREAQAAARVNHDHLLPVLSLEEAADGRAVLVMPLVEGPSLKDRLRSAPELTPNEAAEYIRQVASGLGAAHSQGLVHRDVKPANVLIDQADGRAKLTDFGLARGTDTDATLTRDGTVAGTPEYLAPEQIADSRRAGAAADVYALGCSLYECLTGVVPFRGPLLEVLERQRSEEPVSPRRLNARVPIDLNTICLKCLEKDPNRRYPTANELEADLKRYLVGEPIQARPLGRLGQAQRWVWRNPWPTALGISLLALATLGGVMAVLLATKNRELRESGERAEASSRLTAEALDRVVGKVNRRLWNLPQAEAVLIESSTDAADLHRRRLELKPDDTEIIADTVMAYARLADVQVQYSRYAEALQSLATAEQLLNGPRAMRPTDRELGKAYLSIAQSRIILADRKEDTKTALAISTEAAREAEKLREVHPEEPKFLEPALWEQDELASMALKANDLKGLVAARRRAVEAAERWQAAAPADAAPMSRVASAHDLLGDALAAAGDLTAATVEYEKAATGFADPLLDRPEFARQSASRRGDTLVNRGWLALKSGDFATAEKFLAQADVVRRQQATAYPNDPQSREKLLFALIYRAKANVPLSKVPEARKMLTEAKQIAAALIKDFPQDQAFPQDLAAVELMLSKLPGANAEPVKK